MSHASPDIYRQREAEDPSEDLTLQDPELDEPELAPELEPAADPRPARWVPHKPRFPGFTGTVADFQKAYVIFEEQTRRENDGWTQAAIEREAERRYREACELRHPKLPREYAKLLQASWAPDRKDIRESIEAAACRRVVEWQELEAMLVGCGRGRPSDRRLPIAIFSRAVLCSGVPELRANLKDFQGSNLELDWAFFDTPDMDANTAHMREESAVRKAMKGMLERNDPEQTVELNLQVIRRLWERHEDIGRYLVVDATPISALVEQTVPVNAEHAALVTRNTGATLHHHGGGSGKRKRNPKTWLGWRLLAIADLKSGLPLIWKLIPAGPEYPHLVPMLERLLALAPWLDPEYVVGDSEYDRSTRIAFDLQARLGICPVFPLRENVGRHWDWHEHHGVPHCSRRGHAAMKLHQSEDFMPENVTIGYEPNFALARKEFPGRTRWYCEKCRKAGRKITATTWFRKNPRLYTYLPRGGEHERYARRVALMLRRNSIEGLFSQLKRRGIGNRNHFNCRWATHGVHVEWLCGAALLGMTVRREAHESGLYANAANEAWARGLTKVRPGVPKVAGR